jgi:hypothetical protein
VQVAASGNHAPPPRPFRSNIPFRRNLPFLGRDALIGKMLEVLGDPSTEDVVVLNIYRTDGKAKWIGSVKAANADAAIEAAAKETAIDAQRLFAVRHRVIAWPAVSLATAARSASTKPRPYLCPASPT